MGICACVYEGLKVILGPFLLFIEISSFWTQSSLVPACPVLAFLLGLQPVTCLAFTWFLGIWTLVLPLVAEGTSFTKSSPLSSPKIQCFSDLTDDREMGTDRQQIILDLWGLRSIVMYLSNYSLIKLERQPFFRLRALSERTGSEMENRTIPEGYIGIQVRSHCSVLVGVSGFFFFFFK